MSDGTKDAQAVVRTRNLAVRVPEDVHDAAMERARAEGKTLTALVIGLLREPTARPVVTTNHITIEREKAECSRFRMALEAITTVSVDWTGGERMMAIARQALRG